MLTWPRLITLGLVACAALFAWAVHDITTTWERSLRLPEDQDG